MKFKHSIKIMHQLNSFLNELPHPTKSMLKVVPARVSLTFVILFIIEVVVTPGYAQSGVYQR